MVGLPPWSGSEYWFFKPAQWLSTKCEGFRSVPTCIPSSLSTRKIPRVDESLRLFTSSLMFCLIAGGSVIFTRPSEGEAKRKRPKRFAIKSRELFYYRQENFLARRSSPAKHLVQLGLIQRYVSSQRSIPSARKWSSAVCLRLAEYHRRFINRGAGNLLKSTGERRNRRREGLCHTTCSRLATWAELSFGWYSKPTTPKQSIRPM